jgi:hypothetical protein
MKRSHHIAAGIAASLTLAFATAALAQPAAGFGPGPCAEYGTQAGPGAGMGPGGRMGGPGRMMATGFGGRGVGNQLMTTEEWTAHREKMFNAATPEERQQIAAANHAEMQKRAAENGITLPQQPGPRQGMGPRFRTAPQAPAATE